MPRYPDDINAEISPIEFEQLVHGYIKDSGKELKSFVAIHDDRIKSNDGDYQIDIHATFEFLGANFSVLIECKRHKHSIKREIVQILFDKLRATGSQKGMIFSTSGFQEGSEKFAKEHGIALVRVIDGRFTYHNKSILSQISYPLGGEDFPFFVGEFKWNKDIYNLQKGHLEALEEFLFGIE
jgi:restriction system protein